MSKQQKENTAEMAWKEHTDRRFDDIVKGINGAIKGSFQLTAINDYKKSLTKAIMSERKKVVTARDGQLEGTVGYWAGDVVLSEYDKILAMIETVTP